MPEETKLAEPGSISHGTLRDIDLLEAFTQTLEQLDPAEAAELRQEYHRVYALFDAWPKGTSDITWPTMSLSWEASFLLNEALPNLLEQHAPKGYFFGSHPGDGSDFGFWADDDDPFIDDPEESE